MVASRLTVASWLNIMKPLAPAYERIIRQKAIRIEPHPEEPGKLKLSLSRSGLTPQEWTALNRLVRTEADLIDILTIAEFVTAGPKVYRPDPASIEALENVELGISFSEYRQPYPVMAIELPENYQTTRAVQVDAGANSLEPAIVLIRHDPAIHLIGVSILFNQKETIAYHVTPMGRDPGVMTLEEAIEKAVGLPDEKSDHHSLPGLTWVNRALRVAVNSMLLLTQYGARQLPPDNPSHLARLERHLQLARKGKGKGDEEEAERQVRLVPQVYQIDQEITLSDRQVTSSHAGGGDGSSGITVRPHWRRGHWRRQAVGAGRAERRLVFVRPCLIHPEALVGGAGAGTVVYKQRGDKS